MTKQKENILCMLLGVLLTIPIYLIAPKNTPVETTTIETEAPNIEVISTADVESLDLIKVEEPTTEVKKSLGVFKITAYCPCSKCSDEYGSITSTGVIASEGRTIAVDPDVIPYGSIIEINGHRYVAEDCGGAIKGDRLDIFFNSHDDALEFGVQELEVYLITE